MPFPSPKKLKTPHQPWSFHITVMCTKPSKDRATLSRQGNKAMKFTDVPSGCLPVWPTTPSTLVWSCRLNKNNCNVVLSNIYSHFQLRWDTLSLQRAIVRVLFFEHALNSSTGRHVGGILGKIKTHTLPPTHTQQWLCPEILEIHTCPTLSLKETSEILQSGILARSLHKLTRKKKSCQETKEHKYL